MAKPDESSTTKAATPGSLLDALLDDLRPHERLILRARSTDIRQIRVEIWYAGRVDAAAAISFHVERDVTDLWGSDHRGDVVRFIAEELFDTLRRGAAPPAPNARWRCFRCGNLYDHDPENRYVTEAGTSVCAACWKRTPQDLESDHNPPPVEA